MKVSLNSHSSTMIQAQTTKAGLRQDHWSGSPSLQWPIRSSDCATVIPFPMPINGLPSEILQMIFERVVGIPGRYRPSPLPQQALCSVCRLWRSIALHDPLMWNTLYLPTSEGALKYMECFLQRSASSLLNIYIVMRDKGHTFWSLQEMESCRTRFIELISGESHRWRMLELRVPQVFVDLKSIRNGKAPMLETLVLSMKPDRDLQSPLSPPSQLFPGGSLTSLTVARINIHWDQWNCKEITHLTIRLGYSWTQSRKPLQHIVYHIKSASLSQDPRSMDGFPG
jgi:hypothetical protein